jgi:hypothetical protein
LRQKRLFGRKTNPIQSQFKANSKPIQSQFKANQTQPVVSMPALSKVEVSNLFQPTPACRGVASGEAGRPKRTGKGQELTAICKSQFFLTNRVNIVKLGVLEN